MAQKTAQTKNNAAAAQATAESSSADEVRAPISRDSALSDELRAQLGLPPADLDQDTDADGVDDAELDESDDVDTEADDETPENAEADQEDDGEADEGTDDDAASDEDDDDPQASDEESEGDQTDDSEGDAEGKSEEDADADKADESDDSNVPKGLRKRFARLTDTIKKHEQAITAKDQELAQLRQQLKDKPADPAPIGLDQIDTPAALEQHEATLHKTRSWCLKHLVSGGQIGDTELSPEQVAETLAKVEEDLQQAVPAKRALLTRRQQLDQVLEQQYPAVKDPANPFRQKLDAAVAQYAGRRFRDVPEFRILIADAIIGRAWCEQQMQQGAGGKDQGKGKPAVKPGQPQLPGKPAAKRQAAPVKGLPSRSVARTDPKLAKRAEARRRLEQGDGDPSDLEASILSKLGG